MTSEQPSAWRGHDPGDSPTVEMPAASAWPLIVGLGVVLLGAGVATSLALSAVGVVILVIGLAGWTGQLLPGRGHIHETLAGAGPPARAIQPATGQVEQLRPGMVGYRFRLPEKVHPISAGVRGGILGGLLMPIPALLYGLLSGHGLWYPVNLLAGAVVPRIGQMTDPELQQFSLSLLLVGIIIHVVISLIFGLLYGVLLPTLPDIPRPLSWGALLMPLLWTAVSYSLLGVVNPVLQRGVDWPWFIVSQFIFGTVAALVVMGGYVGRPHLGGIIGGLVGGLMMPLPAVLWGILTGNGIWYPVNLLAGTVLPGMDQIPLESLRQFNSHWFSVALILHLSMSLIFGFLYGMLLPRLPIMPSALVWGGVLMPLLWTGVSYGLMGVVNPILEQRVEWPWFIISQFVFGVAASIMVLRTEKIPVPPAGGGSP